MNWMRLESDSRSQLGVVTSRRIGGAVARNRARRLLREAFRHEQHRLKTPVAMILIARKSIVGQSLAVVSRALQRGLREAGLLVDSSTPSATCVSSS
jgi:ribonuclease P protein component